MLRFLAVTESYFYLILFGYGETMEREHIIWVKVIRDNEIYYSEMVCFNADFYMIMMAIEFHIQEENKETIKVMHNECKKHRG